MDSDRAKGAGTCCILLLVAAYVLVSWSFETVSPIEYGVMYNEISKTLDTENVYTGGWYYTGFTSSFVKLPATI